MQDKTTERYEAVPADVDGLLRNYCRYHLAEPDPLERYQELTQAQGEAFEQVLDVPSGSKRVGAPAPADVRFST
jgi:hypothetical protein